MDVLLPLRHPRYLQPHRCRLNSGPPRKFRFGKQLIETTIEKQEIAGDQLIIHSDRGPSMASHNVAHLLGSLGVTKSHCRPQVSNDNPFSESQFKTMTYRPEFPERFGNYEDALGFCRRFF